MRDVELTKQGRDMLDERKIPEEWLEHTLTRPDTSHTDEEGNLHLFRAISQYDSRILHVVLNQSANPPKVVTLFFDRRVRRPQ